MPVVRGEIGPLALKWPVESNHSLMFIRLDMFLLHAYECIITSGRPHSTPFKLQLCQDNALQIGFVNIVADNNVTDDNIITTSHPSDLALA